MDNAYKTTIQFVHIEIISREVLLSARLRPDHLDKAPDGDENLGGSFSREKAREFVQIMKQAKADRGGDVLLQRYIDNLLQDADFRRLSHLPRVLERKLYYDIIRTAVQIFEILLVGVHDTDILGHAVQLDFKHLELGEDDSTVHFSSYHFSPTDVVIVIWIMFMTQLGQHFRAKLHCCGYAIADAHMLAFFLDQAIGKLDQDERKSCRDGDQSHHGGPAGYGQISQKYAEVRAAVRYHDIANRHAFNDRLVLRSARKSASSWSPDEMAL